MSGNQSKGPASAGPFFDGAAKITTAITGVTLVMLVVIVCGEAFLRSAFNYSLGFAEEVTGYLVVALTLTGAAMAVRSHSLFQVHFLFHKLRPKWQSRVALIFGLLAIFVCVVLAWKTSDLMFSSMARNKFAPTVLRTPLWIPQAIMPLGFGVIVVFIVEQLLLLRRPTVSGSSTEPLR